MFKCLFEWVNKLIDQKEPKEKINFVPVPCRYDSDKQCPVVHRTSKGGSLRIEGLSECCEVRHEYKKLSKVIATLEPDKNYNGISFSKDLVERAKEREEKRNDDGMS